MENYNLNNLFFNKKEIEPLLAIMDNLKFLFGNNQQFNDIVLKFDTLRNSEEQEYDKLSIDMSHFSMEKDLREYLFLLNKAIEESRILEFEYINRKMECAKRIVEPIQIEFTSGHWYIIAFCRIRKDYRRFKLVRIRNMKLGEIFIKNPISKEELEEIFNKSYEENSILVTLKFSNEMGEQLSEYFSKDKIKLLENGEYIVEDFFPKDEGLKKFILGFGNNCEVIAPSKLRKEMSEYIRDIYSKYNDWYLDVDHFIDTHKRIFIYVWSYIPYCTYFDAYQNGESINNNVSDFDGYTHKYDFWVVINMLNIILTV